MKVNVYQIVTDRIIAQLETGVIPLEKPWVNTSGTTVAVSHNDGRVYSLLNQMILGIPGEYVTFDQAKKHGGHIKKGAKATPVVFWTIFHRDMLDGKGNPRIGKDGKVMQEAIPYLKYYSVFHLEDTDGIKPKYIKSQGPVADNLPIEAIDNAIADYLNRSGVTVRNYEQGQSFYSQSADEVVLPHSWQFKNSESYYASLFHELGHSTGHPSRLDRKGGAFGDEAYSKEELVAEIVSAVLCNHFGISTEKIERNTAAYIQSWLKVLKNDPKMIVSAASRAEKAVNLILNIVKEEPDAA